MWNPFKKKVVSRKPKKVLVAHLQAPVDTSYTVEETDMTELSNTDLQNLTNCVDRHERIKNGELLMDSDLFVQTRWGKDRRGS
jgi:hypothetical protein